MIRQVESLGGPILGSPGNSSVAYLVIQSNLEYGEPRCKFDTQHQSTKVTGNICFLVQDMEKEQGQTALREEPLAGYIS